MLLDDVAAGVKSEPDALLFGRGEGVEQSLAHELFGHPLPGVGDRDERRAVLLPGGDAEDAAVGHRLERVDHQVFNHALDRSEERRVGKEWRCWFEMGRVCNKLLSTS